MSKFKSEIIVGEVLAETPEVVVLPEGKIEILGKSIEEHLNALLRQHKETARALKRNIEAQQALQEVMDRTVLLLQDPEKPIEEAIGELTRLLDLQEKLKTEREELDQAYKKQEEEYVVIQKELKRIAKEHPSCFVPQPTVEA